MTMPKMINIIPPMSGFFQAAIIIASNTKLGIMCIKKPRLIIGSSKAKIEINIRYSIERTRGVQSKNFFMFFWLMNNSFNCLIDAINKSDGGKDHDDDVIPFGFACF